MELDRRNFIKGSIAVGSLAALGGLAGCAPKEPDAKDETAETAEKKVPEEFTDGKWIGKAMGHDNEVITEVTVSGGDIANIKVLRCDDTIGVGTVAAPMMAEKLLETKNLDVDAVSGATTTSMAITMAVRNAIENAGGKASDFSKGPVERTGGTAQTADVDVVFMGGRRHRRTRRCMPSARRGQEGHLVREAGYPRRFDVHDLFGCCRGRVRASDQLWSRPLRRQPDVQQRRHARCHEEVHHSRE